MNKRIFASLALLFVFLEIAALVASTFFGRQHFSHEGQYWAQYEDAIESEESFEWFQKTDRFDATLGWRNPANYDYAGTDCFDSPYSITHLEDGRRKSLGEEAEGPTQLAFFGDSTVYGSEVNDDETISSVFYKKFGLKSVNYGVEGYGALQALLHMQKQKERLRGVETPVLAIQLENINRMVNSFRPIYSLGTGKLFGVKPYMESGRIVPIPPIASEEEFKRHVKSRFDNDFWSRPKLEFPYTLSVFRAFLTPAFQQDFQNLINKDVGYYHYSYSNQETVSGVEALIQGLDGLCAEIKKKCVVFFYPMFRGDSPHSLPAMNERFGGENITIVAAQESEIDWESFTHKSNICHPTAAGYYQLANILAKALGIETPE